MKATLCIKIINCFEITSENTYIFKLKLFVVVEYKRNRDKNLNKKGDKSKIGRPNELEKYFVLLKNEIRVQQLRAPTIRLALLIAARWLSLCGISSLPFVRRQPTSTWSLT